MERKASRTPGLTRQNDRVSPDIFKGGVTTRGTGDRANIDNAQHAFGPKWPY